jgi:hypothetical protein
VTTWRFWGIFWGLFILIVFGVGFVAQKLEEISERLRVIMAILQDWDRKKDPPDLPDD